MTGHCTQCGSALPAHVLEGHCPQCLLQRSLELADDAHDPSAVETLPRDFGDYELLAEVARGGMGVIYRARQRSLHRQVALKLILSGPFASRASIERFRAEATAAAQLQHPGVVAIHEVGEEEGQPYFTMDFVEGSNLAEMVRSGPLAPGQAARYMREVALAIHHAHGHGVLHRDLKPSNVLIDSFDQPRVTDFGLAKQLTAESSLTLNGQTLGSPHYMAPEQVSSRCGEVTARSDVYSLGALLYHLITGRAPFVAGTIAETFHLVLHNEPLRPRALNPAVPLDLETICLKCLEKESARRYATAQALADELDRFLRDQPILARPLGRIEQGWRWCRRKPAIATLAAAVALLLLTMAVGSSVAAWRIELARRSAARASERAARANVDLGRANSRLTEAVTFLELQRAEIFFRDGDAAMGLANLAALLRGEPSNHLASERIISTLLHRNWVLPLGAPLQHPGFARSVAFSPSGRYIVSGCADGQARIWDVSTRRQIGAGLRHSARVRGTAFSPDESSIATACEDGGVRIWNRQTGELIRGPLKHGDWVFAVSFSPDGERIVSASGDKTARIWSAQTGELLLTLAGHRQAVRQAVFSPDGALVATASNDATARLWNARTGAPVGVPLRHQIREVLGVAFSPDGTRVATSSRDRTAIIWDVKTCAPVIPPLRHPDGLNDVQFDPTGRIIVTTGFDNTARLWDARTGEVLSQAFRHFEQVNQAAFSPDGQTLATASDDRSIKFWDVRPGQAFAEPMPHGGPIRHVEFSPDGEWVATASDDDKAGLWDGRTGFPRSGFLRHGGPVQSASFSPDGRFVVTASTDYSPWIWEVSSGKKTEAVFQHQGRIWAASFSPDGQRLVTASGDKTARVWNINPAQPITPPLQHSGGVLVARFSPDGTRVVTASEDGTARVWDAASGAPVTDSLRHQDAVEDVCFSLDGRRVATASKDNMARIWDARTGQAFGLPLHHLRTVQTVAFSHDGLRIVTASFDHTARVWDAATGEPLTPALEHDTVVSHACFSPDDQRVVTSSLDGTARIWDSQSGLPLSEPLRHQGRVNMARFSPDGQRIVTASSTPGNAARIWPIASAPVQVPDWLPALGEAVANVSVGAQGTTHLVSADDFAQMRRRIATLPTNESLARAAQWFFADRSIRTISPFQSETVAEYVQHRIAENTEASLEEAIRIDATNAIALARLAAIISQARATDSKRSADASNLARLALRFDPDNREARTVIARLPAPSPGQN